MFEKEYEMVATTMFGLESTLEQELINIGAKKVVNLIERIEKNNYHKSTLGGCIIEKKDGFILFVKEKNKQNLI